MEHLLAYIFLGVFLGFCYDVPIFLFGKNYFSVSAFDFILIGTPILFAVIGASFYFTERFRSKSCNGFKELYVLLSTVVFSLLGGSITFFMGITDSMTVIIIFSLISAFAALVITRPRGFWEKSRKIAFVFPGVAAMAISFYSILLFSAALILVIILLFLICMGLNGANSI